MLVVRTVEAFRVFDIIYVLTGGGPANGTLVISYVAYQETFRFFNLGRGAAVSFLISLFVLRRRAGLSAAAVATPQG